MFCVHTLKTYRARIGFSLGLLLMGLACLPSYAAPEPSGLFLIRLEVQGSGDETVSASAPLALLNTIFDILPKEIREDAEKSGIKLNDLVKEFENLESQDLVKVEDDNEKVRIWIEKVSESDRDALKVVTVHVEEGEGKHQVDLCLPGGLVQVAGQLLKEYGVLDELVKQIPVLSEKLEEKKAAATGNEIQTNEAQENEVRNVGAQSNPAPVPVPANP